MPIAHVNGIDINYQFYGSGSETLVLIGGLTDTIELWDPQVPGMVAAEYRVLRFDNRGAGLSDAPAGDYTARLLADDTEQLLSHLGVDSCHLVGVSMGGMIAQEFAIMSSISLRSLTLACTYAAPGLFNERMFTFWAEFVDLADMPLLMRSLCLWQFTPRFYSDHADEVLAMEAELEASTMSPAAFLSQLNVVKSHDSSSRVAAIGSPTLVMAATEDILIPPSLSELLHRQIRGSEWLEIEGGHGCMWENPDKFTSGILDFVKRH